MYYMDESLSSLQFEGRCIIIYNEENIKHFILSVLFFFSKMYRYISIIDIVWILNLFFSLLGIQFNGFCCRYTK